MNNFNKIDDNHNQDKKINYFRGIINVFLFVLIVFAIFLLSYFLFFAFKAKQVYFSANLGQEKINKSLEAFREGNFSNATLLAREANDNFSKASIELNRLSNFLLVNKISFLRENLEDFKYLAKTAEILSDSAEKSFFIAQEIEDIVAGKKFDNFLEFNEQEKTRLLKLLYENSPELNGIKANIDLSLLYLEKAENNKFLARYDSRVGELKKYLDFSSKFLSNIISFSAVIPSLTGYPDSAYYLILLQYNNELRPTGGFIGSYGIMEIKLGDIVRLETNDIYHLDMPASLNNDFNVSPPEPIKKYLGVNRWFMRDSNWSPDFPTSAKNIKWFFEQEMIASGRKSELVNLSGVIAITPRLITDLLYITGPIEVNGNIYDKDNFTDVLQHEVEMAFREDNISEWDRKNVIGDIVKEIKIKLFDLPSDRWQELLDLFNKNINRKNFLVYLFDDYKREISKSFSWDGEISQTDVDFLMVVDTNLAAFKTDRVMDKRIVYSLNESEKEIISEVNVYYKNNGWFDWQTTRYRTYTRVYVPTGGQLIEASGISSGEVYSSIDQEIKNPKSFFGGFISIEPEKEGVLSFKYKLPTDIKEIINQKGYYSLKVQKQPGNEIKEFKANLRFEKDVAGFEREGNIELKGQREIVWTTQLDQDYELKVYFK